MKKYNKTYENDIEKYRENPQDSEGEEQEEEKSGKIFYLTISIISPSQVKSFSVRQSNIVRGCIRVHCHLKG